MSHTIVLTEVVLEARRKFDPYLKLTEGVVEIGRIVPQSSTEGAPLRVPKFTAYGALAGGLVLELWERDFTSPDALVGSLQLGPIISNAKAGEVTEAPLLAADGEEEVGKASFAYELMSVDAATAEAIEPALLNAIVSTFEPEGEAPTGANAAFDGVGTLHFLSGNKYQGELKGSMMSGKGAYVWAAEEVQYDGDFTRNTLDAWPRQV